MIMNDTTSITIAAARLVGITDEAIRFFQQLDRNTNSVSKRVQQLESFSRLAKEVELKPSADDHNDQGQLGLTKKILIYCYKLTSRILSRLEWVDNGGRHTSTSALTRIVDPSFSAFRHWLPRSSLIACVACLTSFLDLPSM